MSHTIACENRDNLHRPCTNQITIEGNDWYAYREAARSAGWEPLHPSGYLCPRCR